MGSDCQMSAREAGDPSLDTTAASLVTIKCY